MARCYKLIGGKKATNNQVNLSNFNSEYNNHLACKITVLVVVVGGWISCVTPKFGNLKKNKKNFLSNCTYVACSNDNVTVKMILLVGDNLSRKNHLINIFMAFLLTWSNHNLIVIEVPRLDEGYFYVTSKVETGSHWHCCTGLNCCVFAWLTDWHF